MPKFGTTSRNRLNGVHPLLVNIAEKVVDKFDISVMQGVRTTAEQQELYAIGRTTALTSKPVTQLDGVNKKSNHQAKEDGLGYAIDIAPYPIDFNDTLKSKARFYMMAGYMFGVAEFVLEGTGYKLRWGGDWDSDKDFTDQSFDDLPHFELVEVK